MFIGVGVFATRSFERGDFLLEYFGSLIPKEKGELVLEKNLQGSFVYFFEHNSKELWWDVLISFDDLLAEYTKLCHAHFKKFFLGKISYIFKSYDYSTAEQNKGEIKCDTASVTT